MTHPLSITEAQRRTPITRNTDVLVAGAGPAGVAAAVAAARAGAAVQLIEVTGCLGGIWTAGLMSWILDADNKHGLMLELADRLSIHWGQWHGQHFLTRPEVCKLVLETLCLEADVNVRLHTRVVGVCTRERTITHVITESKSGREAWGAKVFVDATGDGDLGALSGCRWDYANPETGEAQPFSLIALVGGPVLEDILDFVRVTPETQTSGRAKRNLLAEMQRIGLDPSYHSPFMAYLGHRLYVIMWNHQYGVNACNADDVTRATFEARAELHRIVNGLRAAGERWKDLHLIATADQIGTREGRRIQGQYRVTADDLLAGARFDDAVCEARFNFDVHATNPGQGKAADRVGRAKPYEIPLRALVAADVDNLFLAGRCLSGDFLAHSSYRVTGIAVATGAAAGLAAARQA